MEKHLALASLSFLAVSGYAFAASASGFATARFGGEHGSPVDANPTSIYYNPAGLAETTGFEGLAEYDLAIRSASYTHRHAATDTNEPAGADGGNNGTGTLLNLVGAPFIGVSYKITKDLAIGAAFYVPIGGLETWNQNDNFKNNTQFPGPIDGAQRWYSISGEILSMYVSGGIAYKIPRTGLSLGVSGNFIRTNIHTVRAKTGSQDDDIRNETRALLDVSGVQGSFAAGVMYEAIPKDLWFGFSYQSRPNVSGGMKLNGTINFAPTLASSTDTANPVSLYQDYPDIFRLGVRYRPNEKSEVRFWGSWERWSAFKDQCISKQDTPCKINPDGSAASDPNNIIQNLERHWQDGFGARISGSYWPTKKLELNGGLGYDSNATPDDRIEPVILDVKMVTLAVGTRYDLTKNVNLGFTFTNFFGIPRDTTGNSANPTLPPPSTQPDASGQYSQYIGLFSFMLGVKLD